jgi:hypothetical protein
VLHVLDVCGGPTNSRHPPVVILGCGRSGISIFGELFDGLGPYAYESEPPFREILTRPAEGSWAVKVTHVSEEHPPDDGLSFPLETLLAAFPSVVIFWIMRHPLDAISSLRVGISRNWRHHPKPPDWEQWLARPLVERCAHHWAYINSHGWPRVEDLASVVHFEDMTESPFQFASNICERLELSAEGNDEFVPTWAARVQDTNNDQFVEAITSRNLSRPITRSAWGVGKRTCPVTKRELPGCWSRTLPAALGTT